MFLEPRLDIHLDPLGGWSGDMFVAAMLDAFPEYWPPVESAVAALELGHSSACRLVSHRDGAGLTGHRFLVASESDPAHASAEDPHGHDHHHQGGHAHRHDARYQHHHRAWASIRRLIEEARLDERVKHEAIAIFTLLAEAEGDVHGVSARSRHVP